MGKGFQVAVFKIEVQQTSKLFCLDENGPILIWVVHLGLRRSSRWSLGSVWAFSEDFFYTYSPFRLVQYKAVLVAL